MRTRCPAAGHGHLAAVNRHRCCGLLRVHQLRNHSGLRAVKLWRSAVLLPPARAHARVQCNAMRAHKRWTTCQRTRHVNATHWHAPPARLHSQCHRTELDGESMANDALCRCRHSPSSARAVGGCGDVSGSDWVMPPRSQARINPRRVGHWSSPWFFSEESEKEVSERATRPTPKGRKAHRVERLRQPLQSQSQSQSQIHLQLRCVFASPNATEAPLHSFLYLFPRGHWAVAAGLRARWRWRRRRCPHPTWRRQQQHARGACRRPTADAVRSFVVAVWAPHSVGVTVNERRNEATNERTNERTNAEKLLARCGGGRKERWKEGSRCVRVVSRGRSRGGFAVWLSAMWND